MTDEIRGGVKLLENERHMTLATKGVNRVEVVDNIGANHTITGKVNGMDQVITFDGNLGSYCLLIYSQKLENGWLLAVSNGVTVSPA